MSFEHMRRRGGNEPSPYAQQQSEAKHTPKLHLQSLPPVSTARKRAPLSWRLGLLADFGAATVYFSLMQEFFSALWYFPMAATDITGYEGMVVLLPLCTLLLSVSWIRRAADRFPGTMRMLSMIGVLSFYVPKSPNSHVIRSLMLLVGVVFDTLHTYPCLFGAKRRRDRMLWAWMISIVFVYALRLRHKSEYKVWTTTFYNVLLLSLGVFSAFFSAIERTASLEHLEQHLRKRALQAHASTSGSGVCANAMALGVLVWLVQTFFATHTLLARWLELPPLPVVGVLVYASIHVGLALATTKTSATTPSITPLLVTALCTMAFHVLSKHQALPFVALFSSLVVCVYVFSTLPSAVLVCTSTQHITKSCFALTTSVIVLHLMHIWIVAYKFCPGGFLLREAQGVIFLLCGAVLTWQWWRTRRVERQGQYQSEHEPPLMSEHNGRPRKEVLYALLLVLLCVFVPAMWHRQRQTHTHTYTTEYDHHNAEQREQYKAMVHHNTMLNNSHNTHTHTHMYARGTISSMIWAVHYAFDNYGRNSFAPIRDFIAENDIKVVGLLETDLARFYWLNNDLVEYLSAELGMYADYGPSTAQNTFGCALLSVYEIVEAKRLILPSPEGELACLIDARIDVEGTVVRVIVTHFGNTEDELDRNMQTDALVDLISENQHEPLILLSYLTTKPRMPNYNKLVEAGLKDAVIVPEAHSAQHQYYQRLFFGRYCEYVMFRNLKHIRYDIIPCGDISDTEGQLGVFEVEHTHE